MAPLIPETGVGNGARVTQEFWDSPVYTGSTKFEVMEGVKNIMITGGAGFIASWLVRHLSLTYRDAYRVVSFDKIDYCASLNNTGCLNDCENFVFCFGDVTDIKSVMRCIRDYEIDTIFHFAAQSHVDLSFGNSFEFTKTNVEGTHVMLESAVKLGVKRFIHISTDEVNGEVGHGDPDLLEDSLLAPTNPYAASKAAAEMYVNAYTKSFKLPAIIVRSNNVYGPHQYPEKIIPKFASLLDRGKPLILHGDGSNKRRYLFAGDAADAFDTILHKGKFGEIYNVGSRDELSNFELSMKMLAHFDIGEAEASKWIQHVRDRPFNDMRYATDAQKLRNLGWEQKTTIEEGLKLTIEWYRKFGRTWWGDVESVLTAFPEVREGELFDEHETPTQRPTSKLGNQHQGSQSNGNSLKVDHLKSPVFTTMNGGGGGANTNSKKRAYEPEGKENLEKRIMLGDESFIGNGETLK